MPLAPAQDFKRIGDGDAGPNTGGMGAYSPVPVVGADVVDDVMERAVRPTLRAARRAGIEYRGVLYAGLMLTADGPEDHRVQRALRRPRVPGGGAAPRERPRACTCAEAAAGRLETPVALRRRRVRHRRAREPRATRASPRTGDVIEGLDAARGLDGVIVFHAGTQRDADGVVTAGGRVLAVTALGADVAVARARAYEAADRISWPGLHRRSDIAARPTADFGPLRRSHA